MNTHFFHVRFVGIIYGVSDVMLSGWRAVFLLE